MEVLEMNPLVRYINIVQSPQRYPEPVLAYDFRMLYMVEGGLCVQMQDKSFVLCPGGDLFVQTEKSIAGIADLRMHRIFVSSL